MKRSILTCLGFWMARLALVWGQRALGRKWSLLSPKSLMNASDILTVSMVSKIPRRPVTSMHLA